MRERKFQVDSNPTFRVRKAKILGHSEYIKALKEDDPQGILSIIKNSFKDDLGLFVMMIRPLHKACKYNAIKTIHFLLSEVKINPNLSKFSSTKKLTALHIAASNENPAALEALLQYDNVNRNCVNSIGETPLINAAERGLLANVEKLLEDKNVNVSFCNYSGHSALDTALIHQKPSVIAPLLKKIDVTFRCQGKTLLQFGVYLSSPECVAELLKDKRIRESASQDENMALKLAVEQKSRQKIKLLLHCSSVCEHSSFEELKKAHPIIQSILNEIERHAFLKWLESNLKDEEDSKAFDGDLPLPADLLCCIAKELPSFQPSKVVYNGGEIITRTTKTQVDEAIELARDRRALPKKPTL